MHLQQTKADSRASGGPQYYFHNVPANVKDYLRAKGARPVVLQTPYGIAKSEFMAVGKDHKLTDDGQIVHGKVGHDRIQQATGDESIGVAIRRWYGLKTDLDFERIDVEATVHPEGHFILVPTAVFMRGARRAQTIEKVASPLSFHHDYQSKFWKSQIDMCRKNAPDDVQWVGEQVRRVVAEHLAERAWTPHEADLLRVAGALSLLGMELSPYVGKGYDCPASRFSFQRLPVYPCPVEIEKRSAGFRYQIARYSDLPRAVVLCIKHDLVNPPDHVDVIELAALAEHLGAVK
ncbi:MAG: hypothetical protein ACHRHE_01960 [Tepidisphaerales bacterium]